MAFDGTHIWVANAGSVSKIDIASQALVGTFTLGNSRSGIVFDGSRIWVTQDGAFNPADDSQGPGNVLAVNSAGTITLASQVGHGPSGIAFDGSSIWVTNTGDNSVTELTASSGQELFTHRTGVGPLGIAFDGGTVWTSNTVGTVSKLGQ